MKKMLVSINTRTLTKIPLPDIQLTAGGLHLQLDGDELTLSDAERGHRLVVMPVAGYMMPWLDGHACEDVVVRGVTANRDGIVIEQEAAGCRVRASWRLADGHIELSATITVTSACQLNRLDLLPAGTQLNLWDVVNYRNAHDGPTAWPELLLTPRSSAFASTRTGPTGVPATVRWPYSTCWSFAFRASSHSMCASPVRASGRKPSGMATSITDDGRRGSRRLAGRARFSWSRPAKKAHQRPWIFSPRRLKVRNICAPCWPE